MNTYRRIMCTAAVSLLLCGCTSKEKQAAVESYNAEKTRIESQMSDASALIDEADKFIANPEPVLDQEVYPELESAVSSLKAEINEIPDAQGSAEEITNEAEKLKQTDLSDEINAVEAAKSAVVLSARQYELVNNPSEQTVISRLESVENVGDISAVTEDNDPNGNLNKQGGYTAAIYFSSPLVDQSEVVGTTVIDKGTEGGGSIEVYASEEDASKRDAYLSAFDGGILSSGSHHVIGTVVIRTSDKLSASRQKELEQSIAEALIKIND